MRCHIWALSTVLLVLTLQNAQAEPSKYVRQLLGSNACSECDLRYAELTGAELANANLAGAYMVGARLARIAGAGR